jgi:ribosomal protein S27E
VYQFWIRTGINTHLARYSQEVTMKVKCPDCDGIAELSDTFSYVRCYNCHLDLTYGQYVRLIGKKNPVYKDILSDYKRS